MTHTDRRRLFIYEWSLAAFQAAAGDANGAGVTPNPSADIAVERDRWRARAAQLEAEASFLRTALSEALAAHADVSKSADRLRMVVAELQHVLAQYTTLDAELLR